MTPLLIIARIGAILIIYYILTDDYEDPLVEHDITLLHMLEDKP